MDQALQLMLVMDAVPEADIAQKKADTREDKRKRAAADDAVEECVAAVTLLLREDINREDTFLLLAARPSAEYFGRDVDEGVPTTTRHRHCSISGGHELHIL